MTSTHDWLSELVNRVEREAIRRPPPPVLEGPGFVMIGKPTDIWVNDTRRAMKRRERISDAAVYAAGILVGLCFSFAIQIWLVNT